AVPGVAALLHTYVGDSTKRAAIFGLDARSLDLHFLNEIEWHVFVRVTADDVGCILALDKVAVFRIRSAPDLVSVCGAICTACRRAASCSGSSHPHPSH